MRILTSFSQENEAQEFSLCLQENLIEHTLEPKFELSSEKFSFLVWIHDEDDLEKAKGVLESFQKKEKIFAKTPPEVLLSEERPRLKKIFPKRKIFLSLLILIFCSSIYLYNLIQETLLPKEKQVLFTPFQMAFLYDVPNSFIELNSFLRLHGLSPSLKPEELSAPLKEELLQIEKIPFWNGLDDWVLKEKASNYSLPPPPLFEKIREGEFWRIFSPSFFHANFLHLLFNMMWLWFLGKIIEKNISKFRYLLLILILAITSNTAQYLLGGPFFFGFSGIITGFAGFTWMRKKKAPWEDYPIPSLTYIFLGIFVLAMGAIQLLSFLLQYFSFHPILPGIANTAHIAGALFGLLLGSLSFFEGDSHEP